MQNSMVTMRCALALACLLGILPLTPARAEFELAGSWRSLINDEVRLDLFPTDYTGVPLSDEGRLKALTYSSSQLSMIERQCQGWALPYLLQGPFGLNFSARYDLQKQTVVAWVIGAWEDMGSTVIWMDGRPPPSELDKHERTGFTTGVWEGDTLVARTTHLKAGYMKRNGLPISDRTTITTRFVRHGSLLSILMVVEDPVYLAEPFVLSGSFEADTRRVSPAGPACISTFEGVDSSNVPHYLPEENPAADEMTKRFGVPGEAALGHPETLYPQYRSKIKAAASKP